MNKQYKLLTCTINGKKVEKMIDVRASLTDVLRDDFRLTSVKKGCEVGECGACNVIIDGECFNSCIYLGVWAEGKEILTLEGLAGPNGELSDIQQAFIDEAAVQCGFCTPGFIMSATELLNAGKEFSDDEIRKMMSGHLCRCTGYENIFRAVKKTMLRRLGKMKKQTLSNYPIWKIGSILYEGIKMLKDCEFNDRTMIIVSLAFCVGVGLTQTDANFFSAFPQAVGDIFNGNAVAGVFVVSLLLSLILPKNKSEKVEE